MDSIAPEDEAVVARLQALGATPIDDGLAAEHLAAMHVELHPTPRRARRAVVAGVAAAAVLTASTGMAAAGVLPGPAQGVAHDVLDTVGVNVPDQGHGRGACVREVARSDDT